MKSRSKLIICLGLILLTACIESKKEEQEKQRRVKMSIKKRKIDEARKVAKLKLEMKTKLRKEENAKREKEKEEARVNPLKNYISDEIYAEGKKVFYEKKQYMFTINKGEFSQKIESLEEEIKNKFKINMLMTYKGTTSAILNYNVEGKSMRTIVNGYKNITIGEEKYYLRAFKDKVQIKKGENPLVISLYSRER